MKIYFDKAKIFGLEKDVCLKAFRLLKGLGFHADGKGGWYRVDEGYDILWEISRVARYYDDDEKDRWCMQAKLTCITVDKVQMVVSPAYFVQDDDIESLLAVWRKMHDEIQTAIILERDRIVKEANEAAV